MRSLFTLFVVHALACLPAIAQTKQVLKTISTNGLTESLVVPSGQTLTIASGGTLTAAAGSTITGIGSGLTIGSSTITSGTSGRALYNNSGVLGELDLASIYLTSATAASTYQTILTAGSVTNSMLAGSIAISKLAVTGTASSGTYLRGDGTWQAISGSFTDLAVIADDNTYPIIRFGAVIGANVDVSVEALTADRSQAFPDADGTYVLTSNTDGTLASGSVTSTMLAGSIALSKLSTTGTANSTTYLRGDGAWTAIDLSSYLTTATAASTYLPLAGGTMTGQLVIPGGSVASPSLATTGDTDTGIYWPAADTLGVVTGGVQRATFSLSGGLGTFVLNSPSGAAVYSAGGGVTVAQLGTSSVSASLCGLWSLSATTGILSAGNRAYALRFGTDCSIAGDAANVFQFGVDHASAATNQSLKAHDVTTGTGASLDLRGGNGSTAGGTVTISTSDTTTPAVRMTVKASGVINMSGMPTSSAGLSSGDLWNDSGTVKIVP